MDGMLDSYFMYVDGYHVVIFQILFSLENAVKLCFNRIKLGYVLRFLSLYLTINLKLSSHMQEDRENILRARESGKGVLTAPFQLLKSKRLGVILTYAVYKRELSSNASPVERIQEAIG